MDKIPPNLKQKIPQPVLNHLNAVEAQLNQIPQLKLLEEKAKIPPLFLVLGLGVVYFLLLLCDFGGELLSNLTGLVYPALESLRSSDNKFWTSYWVTFGLINTLEFFTPYEYIPLYYVFRTALLIWLFAPMTRGANLVYEKGYKMVCNKLGGSCSSTPSTVEKVFDQATQNISEVLSKKDN